MGHIGSEKIMTRPAWIGRAAALGGVTFAMAQNGPAAGGYPMGTKNPNVYSYYGYSGYYARPRYASYNCRVPYYVLGYPVPHCWIGAGEGAYA